MESADAELLIEQWMVAHAFFVRRTLVIYGVLDPEDRAEIEQEVFFAAFLALRRGEQIGYPRAWLRDVAWRMAANYRNKAERRKNTEEGKEVLEEKVEPEVYHKLPSTLPSPEQVARDREQLYLALEGLDEGARDLVLDVRGEGINWKDIAAARGMTVEQARHIYHKAIRKIEANMARSELRKTKRRAIPAPLLILHLFDSLRPDLFEPSPELDRQLQAGVSRRIAAAADPLDPDGEPASSVRPSAISIIAFPRPPSAARSSRPLSSVRSKGALFGMLWIAVVLGYLLSYSLERLLSTRTPFESSQDPSIADVAPPERKDTVPDAQTSAPPVRSSGSATMPEEPPARVIPRTKDTEVARPSSSVVSISESSLLLLDRARTAFQARDARRALDLLAEHARRFPGELESEARRKQMRLVCTASAVRGAPECTGFSPP